MVMPSIDADITDMTVLTILVQIDVALVAEPLTLGIGVR